MKVGIVIFFILVTSQLFGQEFMVGPKAAFMMTKARFDIPENKQFFKQNFKPGYQVGGSLDWPVYNRLNFYTELLFAVSGKSTEILGTGIKNISDHYFIEVPVLFRMRFVGGRVPSGDFKWHVDAGPSLSYWLGGRGKLTNGSTEIKYKIKFGDPPADQTADQLYISDANRWHWALNLGVGMDYPIKEGHWVFVDLRTSFGQTFLTERSGSASSPVLGFIDDTQVNSLSFILSANYMFDIDLRKGKKGKSTVKKRKQY